MPIHSDNRGARRRVLNALRDLTLAKNSSTSKTPAQMTVIRQAIRALEVEHRALLGRPPAATYSDIAANIGGARAQLDQIVADRKQLASTLVTAAKLLGSVSSVLSLIV